MDLRRIRGRYLKSPPETAKTYNKKKTKICGTCLRYSGDSQSESEGDLEDGGRSFVKNCDAAAANQDEEKRAQEFSGQHPPYVAVVRDVVESDHSLRTCIPTHAF